MQKLEPVARGPVAPRREGRPKQVDGSGQNAVPLKAWDGRKMAAVDRDEAAGAFSR
jgi:hypothetical protein